MPISAILTHVEVEPIAEPRLKLAADLANQFDAALVGVAAEIFEPPAGASAIGYVAGEVLVAEAEAVEHDLDLAQTRFEEIAAGVVAGSEFRSGIGLPGDLLAQEARAADLIVCARRHSDSWGLHSHADPGDVLMKAGRPVLVVPDNLVRLDASNVLIAWKDTRESRRAVLDALPFLERAKKVIVAGVCERNDESERQARGQVADVAGFLSRHGVKASTAVRKHGNDAPAAALIDLAEIQEAGLIVAGGYGHTRFREWVFGGVTLELLSGLAARAVLLSH